MRSWCAPPPSLPHRASRPPGSFCFTSPHGCKTAVAAVAITSTFPLADLAAFRRLSRKPRPLPPPGHAVSTAGSGEIRLLPPTCGSFVRRTAVRRAAAGARRAGAPPLLLPLRLLPTPFPVPLSSARRRQDEAPTGVSYVPTRSPCACTRWLSAQLDGLILPGCPAPAWTARGSGGASVPRSRHAPSPARSTEHGARGPGHGEGGAGEGPGPPPACCGRVTVSLPKSLPVCFVWFCPGHCNSAGPPPD